ncbi:hypothetical protein [Bradyrhizobium sp. BWC-3-1]|nr:hypothetical protein [Bradyrhizobium sp. BWC-3-1]WOH57510.1 hypothetical protein RX329_35665 [Bradyrhizobium sp. BWC-3-1]
MIDMSFGDANDDHDRQHQHQHHSDRHADVDVDIDDVSGCSRSVAAA